MALAPRFSHPWDVTPEQARALQAALRDAVRQEPLKALPRLVAGVDVSYCNERARAAVAVLAYPTLELCELVTAERVVHFPYLPGLLAFRELPAILDALARLRTQPDVLLCDAHGSAHPLRFGLAAHLGVLLDWPTLGCAKSLLCGTYAPVAEERGSWSPIHMGEGEVVGAALRTQARMRPVFVSPGHRVTLEDALQLVLTCTPRFRLPRPLRLAHQASKQGCADDQSHHQPQTGKQDAA